MRDVSSCISHEITRKIQDRGIFISKVPKYTFVIAKKLFSLVTSYKIKKEASSYLYNYSAACRIFNRE